MSDVVVKLAGSDEFTLYSARRPSDIIAFIQEVWKKKNQHEEGAREPFDILVDSLSSVVKGHLDTHGKNYITTEYVEKLDETILKGIAIDLRTKEEKILIENWKEKYVKNEDPHDHEEKVHGSHH